MHIYAKLLAKEVIKEIILKSDQRDQNDILSKIEIKGVQTQKMGVFTT